ncbi:MAG: glycosyltransferase family 2 protein [Acidimicrobiia bacterium]
MASIRPVAVILPALDEAEALDALLPRMPSGHAALVVDNGSTDPTAEVARTHGAVVVSEPRRGFGAACQAGLRAASGYEVVAFMDADGSLDPGDLPDVTGPVLSGGADLVVGRRRPAERGAIKVHARAANAYLARRLRARYGLPVHDIGPMRASRRDALMDLGIGDTRFGWPLEMLTRAGAAGWRVHEVDVAYRRRVAGRSKVTGTLGGTLRAVRDMRGVLATAHVTARESL